MYRNYLLIAWRSLRKNRTQSLLNISGLAFGLTCFTLISLYLFDELTYDSFYSRADRIYRVVDQKTAPDGSETKIGSVGYNVSVGALAELPEVEGAVRQTVYGRMNTSDETGEKVLYRDYRTVSPAFLEVLDFTWLAGDRATALQQSHTAVVTRTFAESLYGTPEVLGKLIQTEAYKTPFKITGVLEDLPPNSSLQFEVVYAEVTNETEPEYVTSTRADWTSNNFQTFLLLKENAQPAAVEAKLNQLVRPHRPLDGNRSQLLLQPITAIHFHSADIRGENGPLGDLLYVYVFGAVALFILLIAAINYMNLTTAFASIRTKEIGVRKVNGARRRDLSVQFLTESVLVTLLAWGLALLGVEAALPWFNAFTGKSLSLGLASDVRLWAIMGAVVVFTALLSGSYPAFVLSRLQPTLLLKNLKTTATGSLALRRGLVVFQFVLSFVMIVTTLAVALQLQYVRTKNLGFDQEALVVVDINSGKVREGFQTIKSEYEKIAGVQRVAVTSRVPGEWKNLPQVAARLPENQAEEGAPMYYLGADEDFLETFSINLVAGRNFLADAPTDSLAVLLNESAARQLGITAPAGQMVELPAENFGGRMVPMEKPLQVRVVGIVRDFHFRSLREKIAPMVIGYRNNPVHSIDYFAVQLNGQNLPHTLEQLAAVLHQVDPDHLFEYHFLNEQLALFYREDAKRQTIFSAAALATIFIASLGLFGLAAFTAQQRTKEIGIRKVLGASVASIVSLLSQDFLRLVLVSILLGTPIAWYAIQRLLADFAYRIDVTWWMFAGAGALALGVAFLTVGFQSFKAASSDPVKNLRTE
jgi:putative ABC transport system permease protein